MYNGDKISWEIMDLMGHKLSIASPISLDNKTYLINLSELMRGTYIMVGYRDFKPEFSRKIEVIR
jgi:hypothetical protein